MTIDLTGKKALIAGASRGIGLAMADALARAGADVAICARSPRPLEDAARQLHGRQVSTLACDLSDPPQVQAWVEQAITELGGVDILINNASGFGRTDDESGWQTSISLDLMAGIRASHGVIPHMGPGSAI
jgi:3-oxoacyl-[acyl-carrier protein] reductase